MAWTDEARAAAAAKRKAKAALRLKVMEARTGMTQQFSRVEVAGQMKALRRQLRSGRLKLKKDIASAKSQLSNLRYAAKKGNYAGMSTPGSRAVGTGVWSTNSTGSIGRSIKK